MSNFKISEIIEFIRENDTRGRCFNGWPDDIMGIYLKFHFSHGSLVLVEQDGKLAALGIAVRMMEKDMSRHWVTDNRAGDTIYMSDIIATSIDGVRACVEEMDERMPGWDRLKVYAIRNGKRKRWNPAILKRVRDGGGRLPVEGAHGERGGDPTGGDVSWRGVAQPDAVGELCGVGASAQTHDSGNLCERI